MASFWILSALVLLNLVCPLTMMVSADDVVVQSIDTSTIREACLLTADSGPCRGYFERFAFSQVSGRCAMFVYGGCLGNANRFATSEECTDYCRQGVCPNITCTTECPGGYAVDEEGCRTCQCLSDPTPPPPTSNVCPMMKCRAIYCPNGFKRDAAGCRTCDCAEDVVSPNRATLCPEQTVACMRYCEYGLKRDENNCIVCQCNEVPAACPPSCEMYCENGMKKDANGCNLCECADVEPRTAACPLVGVSCNMFCERGFKKDANGCDLCQCVDTEPRTAVCPSIGVSCTMFCERGFKKDVNGCDLCQCADAEPQTAACPSVGVSCNMFCERGFKKDANGCDLCQCDDAAAAARTVTCAPVDCRMFCEFGWKKNADGCDICQCNDAPQSPTQLCPDISIACQIFCQYGLQKDANGCLLCQCNEDALARSVSCPPLCNMYCQHGMKRNEDGCMICQCNDPPQMPSVCPPSSNCRKFCENGFKKDPATGCDICQCNDCPLQLSSMCTIYCPNGMDTDERGCPVCRCKTDTPKCPENAPICRMFCEHGFKKDANGCATCQCNSPPTCPAGGPCKMFCRYAKKSGSTSTCQMCRCDRPPLTQSLCLATMHDGCELDGCPHVRGDTGESCDGCSCEDDPCQLANCREDQKCVVDYERFQTICIDRKRWCPESHCRIFCENGFETDAFGCDVCRCRKQPKQPCVDVLERTEDETSTCQFGHRYDENDCRTNECLPNPCASFNCSAGKVCEPFAPKSCQTCPAVPRCIDHAFVQRAKISIGYLLGGTRVDDEDLASIFTESMSSLLAVSDDNIRSVTVDWVTVPDLVTISFQILPSASDLNEDPTIYVVKLTNELNNAASVGRVLVVGKHNYFEPQPQTVSALYYSDDYMETVVIRHHSNSAAILACVVIGAMIFAVAFVAIVLLVCRRSDKASKSAIYHKTSHDDTLIENQRA